MAKLLFNQTEGYKWNYCSVGGVVRVNLSKGEDIAHLDELDQKKWTVLSCPVKGLQMDAQTLAMIDSDKDGKIRVAEVVAAAKWLTGVIKDKDSILKGSDVLELNNINTDNEEGKMLYKAAKLVLECLGSDKSSISIADAADSINIFNKSLFNGDGVIVEACAQSDELKKVISSIIACEGPVADLSGSDGVNAATLEAFLGACEAYLKWNESLKGQEKEVFPYGDKTGKAWQLFQELDSKIKDWFMRCKLAIFDPDATAAMDVSTARIQEIAGNNLTECIDAIATCPLAKPSMDAKLKLDGINPVWKARFAELAEITGIKDAITEEKWAEIGASFGPFNAYFAGKSGAEVESLGADYIKSILASDCKAQISALIEKDLSMAGDAKEIASINKLMHLYRDFYTFLNNYVIFKDFYARDRRAIFEAGELYIDQRCCKLCIEVADMGKHADMAGLSGMFLIYCSCTNKAGAKKDIVAVMTDGDIANLRPGKNAIFYDLQGNDWDAVVTKVVDNPINLRKAFWAPYRKAADFVSDKINKNMAAKEAASQAAVIGAADGKGKQSFDIAKFAGIFAAIGMAFGFILSALSGFASFLGGLSFIQFILLVIAIMLVISGPSCFLAWKKLRKRNLGPVLNSNGWAINSNVLINTVFGATLTSVAKYPMVKGADPFKEKTPKWKIALYVTLAVLLVAFVALYFTNCLEFIGLGYHSGDFANWFRGLGDSIGESTRNMSNSLQEAVEAAASDSAAQSPETTL